MVKSILDFASNIILDNEYDSRENYLFEQEIFLEYLKKYFLTPDEYKQWETTLKKDIEIAEKLKRNHNSGTCSGPDKCLYCPLTT